jgi:hypothetical protein
LAQSLVRALGRYEWLREQAADAWPDADVDGDGPEGAAALFLHRPKGWELRLAEIAATEGTRTAVQTRADETDERNALTAERDRLRLQLKEVRKQGDERVRILESDLEEARRVRRRAAASEARLAGGRTGETDRLLEQIAALEARLEAGESVLRQARADLRDERRARAAAESKAAAAASRPSWASEDPLDLAIRLDEMGLMAQPPPTEEEAPVPQAAGPAGPPRLPAGIGPDSSEAFDWVLRRSEPTTLLVDGYNAGFALAGPGQPGRVRERLAPVLEQADRLGAGRLRIIVVYDSSVDSEPRRSGTGSVDVRFTSVDLTADEQIAVLASEIAGPVVVVSSDREVREAAGSAGALALWSQALVEWANRR